MTAEAKLPQRGLGHMFSRFASRIAHWMGAPSAFLIAVLLIVVWLLTGPVFGFSTEWQLIVNSGTTIATFLMVFLIQNTQNRDARATHLKLDELLRASPKARNEFMEAEEEDLDEIEREKAIVDRDDPAPPKERARRDTLRDRQPGIRSVRARVTTVQRSRRSCRQRARCSGPEVPITCGTYRSDAEPSQQPNVPWCRTIPPTPPRSRRFQEAFHRLRAS